MDNKTEINVLTLDELEELHAAGAEIDVNDGGAATDMPEEEVGRILAMVRGLSPQSKQVALRAFDARELRDEYNRRFDIMLCDREARRKSDIHVDRLLCPFPE